VIVLTIVTVADTVTEAVPGVFGVTVGRKVTMSPRAEPGAV
jgi:hypothetical protein